MSAQDTLLTFLALLALPIFTIFLLSNRGFLNNHHAILLKFLALLTKIYSNAHRMVSVIILLHECSSSKIYTAQKVIDAGVIDQHIGVITRENPCGMGFHS